MLSKLTTRKRPCPAHVGGSVTRWLPKSKTMEEQRPSPPASASARRRRSDAPSPDRVQGRVANELPKSERRLSLRAIRASHPGKHWYLLLIDRLWAVRRNAKENQKTLRKLLKKKQLRPSDGKKTTTYSKQKFAYLLFEWFKRWDLVEYFTISAPMPVKEERLAKSTTGGAGWLHLDYWNIDDTNFPDWPDRKTITTYHGTAWFSAASILELGRLWKSCEATLGYAPKDEGVYSTKDIEHALEYALAESVFNDGIYHKVVLELSIDEMNSVRLGPKRRKREEWVTPPEFVKIVGVWCQFNVSTVEQGVAQPHIPIFDDILDDDGGHLTIFGP